MSNLPKYKPDWLKVKANSGAENQKVMNILNSLKLHTVCEEASCPNCGECFSKSTATFMILGRNCTRNCTFCSVTKATPQEVDKDEPKNLANAVLQLGLKHIVITSVTRDDLEDGGAGQFCECIKEIRKICNNDLVIEVLIPDFKGEFSSLKMIIDANPEIINHNVETIPRLYPDLRPMAVFERSLELLNRVKKTNPKIITKSGFMVGVSEKYDEVTELMKALRAVDCDILTIGQYLAPSKAHYPVFEYIHPDVFKEYEKIGYELGFKYVASGPLVRSSYYAEKAFNKIKKTFI